MRKRSHSKNGFTLLELLVVIGIIGLLATIGVGSLRGFNATNAVAAGNRQLMDDINMARNYALNQRTTVYMVFVPPLDTYNKTLLTNDVWRRQFTNRLSGQLTAYNFVTLRTPGDQPGQGRAKYLSDWKSLPEGVFIPEAKFAYLDDDAWYATTPSNRPLARLKNKIPFPSSDSPTNAITFGFPVLAFNYQGQLLGPNLEKPRQGDEFLWLTRGSIVFDRTPEGRVSSSAPPETIETPKGNSTNNPYIRVDWLTGRPRIEERKYL